MVRLDVYLHDNGFFESREQAKRNIMAGNVSINGHTADKAGTSVKEGDQIQVKQKDCPYVSRGGLKLEKAIGVFGLDLQGKTAMDVGASTGGFTDCMLANGAKKVFAIDVGYGQLDWKLRTDSRVVSLERKNFRHMEFEEIGEKVDFMVMDVSFISVTKLVDKIKLFLKPQGQGVVLIKPQFEAGKDKVGRNGIVKDPGTHKEVIERITGYFSHNGLTPKGIDYSPIKGAKGNIEYLLWVEHMGMPEEKNQDYADKAIQNAFNNL
jgi:23S rRNA (cytidine1920-2'-O)/16S rRNA (cytidine1409-2'-O)-methyltransferase